MASDFKVKLGKERGGWCFNRKVKIQSQVPVYNVLSLWFFIKQKTRCFLFLGKIYYQVFISFFQSMFFVFSSYDLDMLVVLDLYKVILGKLRLQYYNSEIEDIISPVLRVLKAQSGYLSLKLYTFRLYVKWTTMRRCGSAIYKCCRINSLELIVQLEVRSWCILIFPLVFSIIFDYI